MPSTHKSFYTVYPQKRLRDSLPYGASDELLSVVDSVIAKSSRKEEVAKFLRPIITFPVKFDPYGRFPPFNSKKWFEERLEILNTLPDDIRQDVDYSPIRAVLEKWIKWEKKDARFALPASLLVLFVWSLPFWIIMLICHFLTN